MGSGQWVVGRRDEMRWEGRGAAVGLPCPFPSTISYVQLELLDVDLLLCAGGAVGHAEADEVLAEGELVGSCGEDEPAVFGGWAFEEEIVYP